SPLPPGTINSLGEAFTKCGFAGETGPRCIIPSVIKRAGMPKPVRVVQYNINTEELYSYLKEFIHILYFRHLLVNPRDRRVVIIESVLCPSHFRETLTRVLGDGTLYWWAYWYIQGLIQKFKPGMLSLNICSPSAIVI
uniref:Uncharacterized protein n=1 Tax=Callithrix jacchus TaxID=9483 RepID=A0A8I3WN19_CALJA